MSVKRAREKSLLSRQEIASRRKAIGAKKFVAPGNGRRAIVAVVLLAASVLAFFSIATFDVHDRAGPGFRNAVGPVGHAIAEALRGLLGVCAFVLPLVGFYASALIISGEKEKRRWPQALALGLLLLATTVLTQLALREDPSWAHAPGGLVGRELAAVLTALFSTVGTVVLMSAVSAVAFIVGTELHFLRFCAWAWDFTVKSAVLAQAWGVAFLAQQKKNLAARGVARVKDRAEEAAFLASLESEEAKLDEAEAAALEADFAADESAREQREVGALKEQDILERERARAERERLLMEREAAKLAREALKSARLKERESRQGVAAAAIVPSLLSDAGQPMAAAPPLAGGDPTWASLLSMPLQPQPTAAAPNAAPLTGAAAGAAAAASQPPPRRLPTIHEPPPLPKDAFQSLPPPSATESAFGAINIAGDTAVAGALASDAVSASAAGALATVPAAGALARVPLIIEPKAPPKPTKKVQPQFEMAAGRTGFDLPPVDLLEAKVATRTALDKDAYLSTAEKLTAKLRDFGIDGEVVEIRPGPVVTMYEFKPAAGVKISRIASLADDLAMAMEAMRVRIVAPIPGKGVVGIEVPNRDRETVFLKEIAEQDTFTKAKSQLTMCLGKDIEGMPYILDLAKAPHLLMAGTTGSGKSVSVNSMIMSLLLKSTPEEVRFIMVDPKMLELSVYEGIPHLLLPVVTDPRKAAIALQWAVEEMTRRYKLLAEAGVRNIAGYNQKLDEEQRKKSAAASVVDAKPSVIKPKDVLKAAEARPGPVEGAKPPEPPAEAKAEAPAGPPKKKRRLLIVDVASEAEAKVEGTPPEGTPAVEAAVAPALELGVAAPKHELENPREELPVEVLAAVEAAATEGEIRVDESQVAEATEDEARALAEAAASGAAAEETEEKKKLPYIVVIIDELADLMMVAAKEVETSIARLAQMARAAGIHLMVATQRPSTDVVTGLIKANFPTRISFMLRTKIDSMTILGATGSEALLGMGDMLILPPTSAHLTRVHGCFVSETEIKRVVDHLKMQAKPVYDENILKPREEDAEAGGEDDELVDEMYGEAMQVVAEMKTISISMLQRKMRLGYNRAARIIERMERDGLVGPADGAKPREVIMRPLGGVGAAPM